MNDMIVVRFTSFSFFFTQTATTDIYTLSLHDALPISIRGSQVSDIGWFTPAGTEMSDEDWQAGFAKSLGVFLNRSEEHTSELQSRRDLVCRLLLEKKKRKEEKLVGGAVIRLFDRGLWF